MYRERSSSISESDSSHLGKKVNNQQMGLPEIKSLLCRKGHSYLSGGKNTSLRVAEKSWLAVHLTEDLYL